MPLKRFAMEYKQPIPIGPPFFAITNFSDGANPNGTMRLPLLIPLRLNVHPLRGD